MQSEWWNFFIKTKEKIINSNETLNQEELERLRTMVQTMQSNVAEGQYDLMLLGRLLDYNELKAKGRSKEEILDFYIQDEETIKKANLTFKNHTEIDRFQMFGYPANMSKDSYLISYLRWIESKMYFMNSCGDAYHPGNYRMNNCDTEIEIIELIKENLNLPKEKYWGYINSGGTEANFWGLREGLTKYPNGLIYSSNSAHYGVDKFINIIGQEKSVKISSNRGKIDTQELLEKIKTIMKKIKHQQLFY